jgi:hypothetical protein
LSDNERKEKNNPTVQMKVCSTGWFLGSLLSLLLLLLLLVGLDSAQAQDRGLVGGYVPVEDLQDPSVVEAAAFALTKASSSSSHHSEYSVDLSTPIVIAASQQVVAGINLKLIIMILNTNNKDCQGAFLVTIYNHFGTMEVTEWGREYTCAEAKVILESGMIGVEDGE